MVLLREIHYDIGITKGTKPEREEWNMRDQTKEVVLWAGAGQIGMAIARRIGHGKKLVVGDKKLENARNIARIMNEAGFDVTPVEMDLSSRASILNLIAEGN